MKHIHAEIIKAMADNTSLSLFCRDTYDTSGEWWETSQWPIQEEFEYFLCLPQHHTPCLHWLNGGEVQHFNSSTKEFGPVLSIADDIDYECDRLECTLEELTTVYKYNPTEWSHDSIFMNDSFELRIKPQKVKRWIGVFPWAGNDNYVVPIHFETQDNLDSYISSIYGDRTYQAIEIEVEV